MNINHDNLGRFTFVKASDRAATNANIKEYKKVIGNKVKEYLVEAKKRGYTGSKQKVIDLAKRHAKVDMALDATGRKTKIFFFPGSTK